ncbi:Folylpolyglutamate synthase, variant 4 [Lathyrus oleraceus]|uniref:Folylpolyglutamate synthase n=1 Tax=Pisum sativum TaxID=3888 RepID=A0A9D4W7N1_PEA|nr:Folylpolyglutamate synthase, variant 4 [Pisum sativum]
MRMIANFSMYPNTVMIGVSHSNRSHFKSTQFPAYTTFDNVILPAYTNINNVIGRRFVHKTSSEVLLERGSNVVSNGQLPNFPSSSYEAAMEKLSSLITRQRRGEKPPLPNKLGRMSMYLKILGLEEDMNRLKIIHVAGTKGKGSTCIFCEAILRECGFRTGVFTSPHLIDVRERFRIDGIDISEDKFLECFWDCWNQLEEKATEQLPMPPLFQFLTILSFKIFTSEQVDAAIIEVGLGGTEDSTNAIKEPTVCGITSLGMDHTEILGDTLGQIASHKAGIFKPKVPAFTVPQPPEAMDVIIERAKELMVPLEVTEPLDCKQMKGLTLGLSGDHQFYNAALAVSLSRCWLQRTGNWEKVCQNILLFNCLDVRNPNILLPRLVNGCSSSGIHFSRALFVPSMSKYTKVTSGASVIPSDLSGIELSWQFNLQRIWEKIVHGKEMTTLLEKDFKAESKLMLPPNEFLYDNPSKGCPSHNYFPSSAVIPSLPLTIKWLRDCVREHPSTRLQVLVTGSLHLVGDVLKLLKR